MSEPERNAVARVGAYQNEAGSTTTDGNDYEGLQIHAWRGLHNFLGARISEIFPKTSSGRPRRALDLASGTGAMTLRLQHLGFETVGSDLVGDNFRLHDTTAFKALDLNKPFAQEFAEPFDLIMAVELIEHLENPRHLLRECFRLLRPGGTVIVTTPNLNSPVSKAMFTRFGTLAWFTDEDYQHRGHITPVSRWQMEQCAKEIGFTIRRIETFGDSFDTTEGWLKLQLLSKLMRVLSDEPRDHDGAVLVTTLTRPA